MGAYTSKVQIKVVNLTNHCLVLRDSFRTIYGDIFGVVTPDKNPQVVKIKIPHRTYFRVAILLLDTDKNELPTGLHIDVPDLFHKQTFTVTQDENLPKTFHLRNSFGEDKLGRVLSGEKLRTRASFQ